MSFWSRLRCDGHLTRPANPASFQRRVWSIWPSAYGKTRVSKAPVSTLPFAFT